MMNDKLYDRAIARSFNSVRYDKWRKNRIDKLIRIFGEEFFKNLDLLELGCGVGHVGNIFEEYGSIVTFVEGYKRNFENIKPINKKSKKIYLDLDNDWDLKKKFDVVVHWGVLYHLDDWRKNLKNTMKHTDLMFLESVVSPNKTDKNIKVDESVLHNFIDQSVNGIGSRPTTEEIENELDLLDLQYTRYDDKNLSTDKDFYHWKNSNVQKFRERTRAINCFRRFWIVERK